MVSRKVTFAGHSDPLAARLDMPAQPARAYALFAHCFTCSKDILAARAIAQSLADLGIAVLRFDFTGLGHSQGEFANTSFSSNVEDLVAAADYLRQQFAAPALLIGHSLGGAAVIAAAGKVPEAKAVVTIGAPAEPRHVLKAIGKAAVQTGENEQMEVDLGGRPFTISRQFIQDVSRPHTLAALGKLKKALLVLHAPQDKIVSIDNASDIFLAAKHPKSFVSLDDADHLLTQREDAAYVAEVISAWASRYLPAQDRAGDDLVPEGVVRVSEADPEGFLQHISAGGQFHFIADEPLSVGGTNRGPSPYQLLSAALGACTSMTMRMYARRKKIEISRLFVDVTHSKSYASDQTNTEKPGARIDVFTRTIGLEGEMDDAQRKRLLEIANLCPVHKTLEAKAHIETRYQPKPEPVEP